MVRLQKFQTLSIIIPTLNEANHLPLLFADLNACSNDFDLIIVDGGSKDMTVSIAQIQGVNVIKSPKRNRGYQLSIGASKTQAEWLLFIHADSRLDQSCVNSLFKVINNKASCDFAWYFDFKIKKSNLQFRILEAAVALRSYFLQRPYGDQGLLIHRDLYNSSGGFSSLKIMEDLDLITRINKKTKVKSVGENLYTNDRKWSNSNIIIRAIKNAKLRRKWRKDYDIDSLYKEYYS